MLSSFRILKDQPVEDGNKRYVIPIINIETTVDPVEEELQNEEVIIEAEQEAQNIISQAKQEAAKIVQKSIEEAAEKIEAIKREAYEEAYRQGYEQGEKDGYQVGFQTADKEGELIRKQAKMVLEGAHKKAQEITEKNQKDVISLSVQIASKIMSHVLSDNMEYIVDIAKDAMFEFKNKKQIMINVHPSNKDLFERSMDAFTGLLPNTSIIIMVDEKIQPSGCIIESDTLNIDTQITSQLEQVKSALLEMRSDNE